MARLSPPMRPDEIQWWTSAFSWLCPYRRNGPDTVETRLPPKSQDAENLLLGFFDQVPIDRPIPRDVAKAELDAFVRYAPHRAADLVAFLASRHAPLCWHDLRLLHGGVYHADQDGYQYIASSNMPDEHRRSLNRALMASSLPHLHDNRCMCREADGTPYTLWQCVASKVVDWPNWENYTLQKIQEEIEELVELGIDPALDPTDEASGYGVRKIPEGLVELVSHRNVDPVHAERIAAMVTSRIRE
jgi:hypothetical protein